VCGNNKCEPPYETCANCPGDCGACMPKTCLETITCALGCIDLMSQPPKFSVTCVANCVSEGCPNSQFFVDQALNCFVGALPMCGGDFNCLQGACGSQIAACIGANCH